MVFDAGLLSFAAGIFGIAFSAYLVMGILKMDAGSKKMQDIAGAVSEGAMAYLNRQYSTVAVFALVITAIIYFAMGWPMALAFLVGAGLSAASGYIGMWISVRANVRTAQAASNGLDSALATAFKGGSVTGFAVVGLGLIGVSAFYLYFNDVKVLIGLGFGASLISLFARVGGGIYTKAADVGADLVGKVEKGIPEDDPRNPAVIADNVGDNVGDCAGMGADLFESYVVTIVAAMLLASITVAGALKDTALLMPLLVCAAGIVASVIGMFFVRLGKSRDIMNALSKGVVASCAVAILLFYAIMSATGAPLGWFVAAVVGVLLTLVVGYVTDYYTARDKAPVMEIAKASTTGAGTNLISGMAVGLKSTIIPVLAIVAAILVSYYFGDNGVFGVAIAAAAMLSMTGIIVAVDSYGPITDNAGGIAEMAGLDPKVRKITDALDAVGNTTKATTKGFAIASAALSALVLFQAYADAVGFKVINVLDPMVVVGLFIGGALPFLFSSYLMRAVGIAAFKIVEEVRRQFREIKGIMSGKARPDYARCVDISTMAALKELVVPGVLSVFAPLLVGLLLGKLALAGLLVGAIVSGLLLALFMANTGAAWDNAKKYIEIGNYGGKGSDAHKAAVVGDTVGDPFKDTAGPALNSLIKVLNTISLLAAEAGLFAIALL
ncbi:MAG: sodium-translocating pyrophosphatase [Candidatus Micrarchaeia archaeon]